MNARIDPQTLAATATFADFVTTQEWNGRQFIIASGITTFEPGATAAIADFAQRIDFLLRPFGFEHWSQISRLDYSLPNGGGWRTTVTMVGPGVWADPSKLPDIRSD